MEENVGESRKQVDNDHHEKTVEKLLWICRSIIEELEMPMNVAKSIFHLIFSDLSSDYERTNICLSVQMVLLL